MDFKIIIKSAIGVHNMTRDIVVVCERLILPRKVTIFVMMMKCYFQFKNKNK